MGILNLPDEILFQVLDQLPLEDFLACQQSCRRFLQVCSPLHWKSHCFELYQYWSPDYDVRRLLSSPTSQTNWKHLLISRLHQDAQIKEAFEGVLNVQHGRIPKIRTILSHGENAKDILNSFIACPEDADDVLARRYWSNEIFGAVNRVQALRIWKEALADPCYPVERALAAIDLFVVEAPPMTVDQVSQYFDNVAQSIVEQLPNIHQFSDRQKALVVAEFVTQHNLTGVSPDSPLQRLQHCLITVAISDPEHSSLQFVSCAIFAAISRRLGLDAHLCCYPYHVYATVKASGGVDLNGSSNLSEDVWDPSMTMFLDPFSNANEVPIGALVSSLRQLTPGSSHNFAVLKQELLMPASTRDILYRAAKNIQNSIKPGQHYFPILETPCQTSFMPQSSRSIRPTVTNSYRAAYCSWWLQMLSLPSSQIRSLQFALQQFSDDLRSHFKETDASLVEEYLMPLFSDPAEKHFLLGLMRHINEDDSRPKIPRYRKPSSATEGVQFRVGDVFLHKRYDYTAIITGWDPRCDASEVWMRRMQMNSLDRGANQPFYNIIADDQSIRYVANDNISLVRASDDNDDDDDDEGEEFVVPEGLMRVAGRYFKRYDAAQDRFISNMTDQYPDD